MIKIIVAENKEQLAMAGYLRWLVYTIQDGKFPDVKFPGNVMIDRHDTSGHSTVFLALNQESDGNEIPIATIRLTRDSEEYGLPLVDNYDIENLRRQRQFKEPIFSVGMLAVHKDYRRSLELVMNLIRFLTAHACALGCQDVVATINHELEKMMQAIGLARFADEFWSEKVGNTIVPVYGICGDLKDKLCRRIMPDEPIPYIAKYSDIKEMRLYSNGEILCREGETGNIAWAIIRGGADILKSLGGDKEYQIARIGPGGIIGEMALFEGGYSLRSATVQANNLIALVIERERLLESLGNPAKALALLKVLSERICWLNSCIGNSYNHEERVTPLPKSLLEFIQKLEYRQYAEWQIVCEENAIGNEAYLVESGKVVVFARNIKVAILPPGSIFGEMALVLEDQRRTATVIAVEPAVLRVIRKTDLLDNAELLRYLCIIQSLRIRTMNEIVVFHDQRGKICDDLIVALQTFNLEKLWGEYSFETIVRDIDWLAGQTGVSKEELSPYVEQLKEGEVIRVSESEEIIVDMDKLQKFSFKINIDPQPR